MVRVDLKAISFADDWYHTTLPRTGRSGRRLARKV